MYVMLDRSVSMTKPARVDGKDVTRWEALRVAVEEFVENPEAVNVGMGLQFFNLSGGADKAVDCTASNYAEPLVPVANAPQSGPKIVDEMTKMAGALGGLTPTVPALQGAIQYAKELAPTRAGRKPVVVLVTDGLPTYCDDRSVAAVSAAAEAGYEGSPSIPTYVVGIEGDFNLDQIARKGGTRAAFNVRRNEDAGDKLVSALLNITESPIICEYEIPTIDSTNQEVDLDKVSLIYTPESTGKAEEFPRVQDASSCASAPNGGWYYDNPSDPKKILVCPCTCSRFGAGRVDVRLGCKPREWLG
jgi:hypothetical protein